MARFFDWTPSDSPGRLLFVGDDEGEGWDKIRSRYGLIPKDADADADADADGEVVGDPQDEPNPEQYNRPLERVIEIAKEHGVQSVLVEYRYIDADFRSEHAHFYAGTFRRYPSVCHRLHFFAEEVDPGKLSALATMQDAYRGYSVMRPLPMSPVGRTMIAPPPELDDAAACWAPNATKPPPPVGPEDGGST